MYTRLMTNELGLKGWRKTVSDLSDELLWDKTLDCARNERERTAWLVAHLAEVYRRDLALKRGYSSIYRYAREVLQLSEAMTWDRVSAAQLALQLPETIEKIASGELSLSAAGELWKGIRGEKKETRTVPASQALQPELVPAPTAQSEPEQPVLKVADKRELLGRVLGKSRRESEAVISEWKQERSPSPTPVAPAPKRTNLGLSLSDADLAKWDRLRDLLSHRLGSRDPNEALLWLIEQGLEKIDPVRQEARAEKRREKKTETVQVADPTHDAPPRLKLETVRQERKPIPAALKRAVWVRDQSKCQHQDPKTGRKCESTAFLDLDHIIPVARGGQNTLENLRLACSLHNRRRYFWSREDQPLPARMTGEGFNPSEQAPISG
mgnify:CR=1 FL=1